MPSKQVDCIKEYAIDSYKISSIYLPSDRKYYQLGYRDSFGKPKEHSLKTANKKKAEQRAHDWLVQKNAELIHEFKLQHLENDNNSKIVLPSQTTKIGDFKVSISITLIQAYRDFLETKKPRKGDFKDGKPSRHYQALKCFLNNLTAYDFEWSDLSPKFFMKFVDSLSLKYTRTSSYNKFVLFDIFLNYCVECSYIPKGLQKQVKAHIPKKARSSASKSHYISETVRREIFRILKDQDYDMYLLIKTIYFTVSRPQEIANLQDFHIKSKFHYIEIPMSKTRHSKIIEDAKELIDELMDHHASNLGRSYIFASQGTRYYSNKWNTLMGELGLRRRRSNGRMENDFDIKHFRHTSITEIFEKTKDLRSAQRFAGHSKIETTKGYCQNVASMKDAVHTH